MCSVYDLSAYLEKEVKHQLNKAGISLDRVQEVIVYKTGEDAPYQVWAVCPENDMEVVQAVGEGFAHLRVKFDALRFQTELLDLQRDDDREKYEAIPRKALSVKIGE